MYMYTYMIYMQYNLWTGTTTAACCGRIGSAHKYDRRVAAALVYEAAAAQSSETACVQEKN